MLARALRGFPALHGDRKPRGAGHGVLRLRFCMGLYIDARDPYICTSRRYVISAFRLTWADAASATDAARYGPYAMACNW